jgi:hypothetical protein
MRKRYFIVVLLMFLDAKCLFKPLQPGQPLGDSIQIAIGMIEQGIRDIQGESGQWRYVLEKIAKDLPEDISSLIRNEAQQFASRTIAVAGVEASCRIDMLGKRAVGFLQGLLAKLKNEPPPVLSPTFCQVIPGNISLSDNPNTWQTITLFGYDFDNKDTSGNLMSVDLLSEAGSTTLLSESYIGRNSYYQITLNLSQVAPTLYQNKIAKLRIVWNGAPLDAQGQITIAPWKPKISNPPIPVPPSSFTYTPPKTKGDADFDTDDDEPMTIEVNSELIVTDSTIDGRVYLKAREPRPDYTTAEGWSPLNRFYTAPSGWKIVSVQPSANCSQTGNITTHGPIPYNCPAGSTISKFTVWGDRDGDEAGSYTKVQADWRAMQVTIEETKPSWLP